MLDVMAPSVACARIFDRPTTDGGHHASQSAIGAPSVACARILDGPTTDGGHHASPSETEGCER
jgi:hypothetical protein